MLELINVSRHFGGLQAISDLTMTIGEGRITAVIGPNGAGKTTLFNLITGFLPVHSGEIRYRGESLAKMRPSQILRLGIARTFQDLRLFGQLSALDNVRIAVPGSEGYGLLSAFSSVSPADGLNKRTAAAEEVLDFMGLADKRHHDANSLSYGDQKALAIARVLATECPMLLLDEPAAGLDQRYIASMFAKLREAVGRGRTICIVEHNIAVVRELCDYVIVLHHGTKLAEGVPEQVMRNEQVIDVYLGKPTALTGA